MAIVETQYGQVEGVDANGLNIFLGIRYAAPPVKEKRWAPPSDPAPWTGRLSCNEWSAQSWQPIVEDLGPLEFTMSPGAGANRSEDCLFLNVWSPGLDQRKRPVMVWIHGGGFEGGTAGTPMHDGASLARRGDVVVVTINYRLGTLGFLNLNEATNGRIPSTGNEGLLDQIKALEWVQNNIDRFGGDPNKVTLFGESAGAMSIGTLLTMEAAKGLFHQAILQSGACSTAQTKSRAAEAGGLVLEHAGIGASADTDTILSLDPQVLMDAGRAASTQLGGSMIFQPCIDGEHLSDMPLDRINAGSADGIPLLVGATRDEWRLFTAMGGFPVEFDETLLETVLGMRISDPAKVISTYREARSARGLGVTPLDLFAAIETDRVFRVPGIRLAEAVAERGQDAFQFLFTWESPWG
ncbi:MAG: carboxylesterase family protein, partial [Gammaproteobacteria bacterium]